MSEINDLVAAELSKAAYVPVPRYGFEHIQAEAAIPQGWEPVQGSDNLENFISDVLNAGGSQWLSMKTNCNAIDRFLVQWRKWRPSAMA